MRIISKLSGKIQVRIFTNPYMYRFHPIAENAIGCNGNCSMCSIDDDGYNNSYRRWNVGSILRSEKRSMILDFGVLLMGAIQPIHRNRGGSPLHYDLKIDIENKTVDVEEISYLQNNLDTDVLRIVKFDLSKKFSAAPHFERMEMPNDFCTEEKAMWAGYSRDNEIPLEFNQFDIYEVDYK